MVDGRPYIIRMVDQLFDQDGDSLDGTTDTKMGVIDIRKDQSIAEERDTIVHELLHACFDQNIRNYEKKKFTEEESVRRVTPKLLKVIRDNPELMEYLTQP
jgi:Zn-dependent peptidase ImmA (M78 family)